MFQMMFELDEDRMRADGLDVTAKWREINQMLRDLPEIGQPEKGVFITHDSGARSWFMELLEETSWFLEYVLSWKIDDGCLQDDVIEGLRDLGFFPEKVSC